MNKDERRHPNVNNQSVRRVATPARGADEDGRDWKDGGPSESGSVCPSLNRE
jgi:hypothetical protein